MERLAIMGGTFDPVHMGHLRMAHAVQQQLVFDKVVFLPAYIPPHKQTRTDLASWEDRLAMVELGIRDYDDFVVSCLELDRGGVSYTFDTVNRLQDLWPDAKIYVIIGEDSLTSLYTWYKVIELLRMVYFVAAERPGYEGEEGMKRLTRAYGSWAEEKIIHAEIPETAISSTEIRRRLRDGKPIRGMVPLAVEQYIYENGLYRPGSEG